MVFGGLARASAASLAVRFPSFNGAVQLCCRWSQWVFCALCGSPISALSSGGAATLQKQARQPKSTEKLKSTDE